MEERFKIWFHIQETKSTAETKFVSDGMEIGHVLKTAVNFISILDKCMDFPNTVWKDLILWMQVWFFYNHFKALIQRGTYACG